MAKPLLNDLSDDRRSAVRRIALARFASLTGGDASAIAINFALYAQTRSTLWLAAGMLVTFGLGSLLGPLGGRIADRFERKRVMIVSELIAAIAIVSLVFSQSP